MHEPLPPTVDENGDERHPAWAMISASRSQGSGAVLFDSDVKHMHTIHVRLSTASRRRDLQRDWLHAEKEIVEIQMSEAQWASFVSTMNTGSGVPCTLRRHDGMPLPGVEYEPRLKQSMDETRGAAERAFAEVAEAFAAYEEKKNAANLRTLKYAIQNAPANVAFASESLAGHAEHVVQRARADIEAMVTSKAAQLGIEPGDLGDVQALGAGDE